MKALRATVARLGILVILLLPSPNVIHGQQRPSVDELLQQFESATAFTQQFVVGKAIVAANDRSVLPRLEPWLMDKDRCLRGNAAYIFGRLGDPRGFDVIVAILGDRSVEREVHEISSVGLPWIQGQLRQDRYYAAHLLGDLKDPRAIPILVALLTDPDVKDIVPWSLGQIDDRSAIEPLIQTLAVCGKTRLFAAISLGRLSRYQ
jgi:HEAT repeat protein